MKSDAYPPQVSSPSVSSPSVSSPQVSSPDVGNSHNEDMITNMLRLAGISNSSEGTA